MAPQVLLDSYQKYINMAPSPHVFISLSSVLNNLYSMWLGNATPKKPHFSPPISIFFTEPEWHACKELNLKPPQLLNLLDWLGYGTWSETASKGRKEQLFYTIHTNVLLFITVKLFISLLFFLSEEAGLLFYPFPLASVGKDHPHYCYSREKERAPCGSSKCINLRYPTFFVSDSEQRPHLDLFIVYWFTHK